MKHKLFISLFIGCLPLFSIMAQLKIDATGQATFGNQTDIAAANAAQAIDSTMYQVRSHAKYTTAGVKYGIYSSVEKYQPSSTDVGAVAIYGFSTSTTNVSRNIGVYGVAQNGYRASIGIAGVATNAMSKIGVYGSLNTVPSGFNYCAYAGYFDGNTIVKNGTLNATLTSSSDMRLKTNVNTLNRQHTLENLLRLTPIEYNLKQITYKVDSLNADSETISRYDEKSEFFQKKHYGLSAQELQKIYPDLVYTGGDGYLEVNYVGLVPLLLEAIQSQQAAIEALQQQLSEREAPKRVQSAGNAIVETALLQQNTPNPFTENTEIAYALPAAVQAAALYIYDMNGTQISKIPLSNRGNATITISGGTLAAGMYLYSLIADGQVIDTKRMILTK